MRSAIMQGEDTRCRANTTEGYLKMSKMAKQLCSVQRGGHEIDGEVF
jgi:hypothetical protein